MLCCRRTTAPPAPSRVMTRREKTTIALSRSGWTAYAWPVPRCHDADMLLEILEEKGVPSEPLSDYVNAFRCCL